MHNVEKPFDNKTAFQISSYTFGGVVSGDDVKLLTSTGNTANINVGTYPDCKVTLGITGIDSKNYVLKDTEAVVTVTISPREIGGAKSPVFTLSIRTATITTSMKPAETL
ncbi:MAG: YDG domain-containing protein [Clostridiales bacterium]|nr:MAG: YDG domain-containing protein [Clostridiales bacterium]